MFRELRLIFNNTEKPQKGPSLNENPTDKAKKEKEELFSQVIDALGKKEYGEAAFLTIEWLIIELGEETDQEMILAENNTKYEEPNINVEHAKDFKDGVAKFIKNPAKKSYFNSWFKKWEHIKGADGKSYIDNGKHYQSVELDKEPKEKITNRIKEKGYFASAENHGWNKREPLLLICNQTMYMFMLNEETSQQMNIDDPNTYYAYKVPVSTGKNGWGYRKESNMTPPGHSKLKSNDFYDRKPTKGIAVAFGRVFGIEPKADDPVAIQLSKEITDKNHDGKSSYKLNATRGIGFHGTTDFRFGDNVDPKTRSGRSLGCFRAPTGAVLAVQQQVMQHGSAHIIATPVELHEDSLPTINA